MGKIKFILHVFKNIFLKSSEGFGRITEGVMGVFLTYTDTLLQLHFCTLFSFILILVVVCTVVGLREELWVDFFYKCLIEFEKVQEREGLAMS